MECNVENRGKKKKSSKRKGFLGNIAMATEQRRCPSEQNYTYMTEHTIEGLRARRTSSDCREKK